MEKFFKFLLPIICLPLSGILLFAGIAMDESLKKVYTTWPVYAVGIACIAYFVAAWRLGWLDKKYK